MSEEINSMFSDIHEKYDTMNHVLSLGIDKIWRENAAKETIIYKKSYKILDLAVGTGEFAIAIKKACDNSRKDVSILGVDFNKDMLKVAKAKVKKLHANIKLELGDVLNLKLKDNSFDVVTSAFALRDFDNLDKFIKEVRRVLKRNGKIVLMDMSSPQSGLMKYLFRLYSNIMILEGMLVDRNAYSFLVSSIEKFDTKNLLKLLKNNGFKKVTLKSLPFGAAFVVTASKY
jgi:demethylmenaquinone methyltransferase / 2-methoxy-6-polyprenyl-1,4-benzoquinol methylase